MYTFFHIYKTPLLDECCDDADNCESASSLQQNE